MTEEDDNYFSALTERAAKPPRKTEAYRSDPAMDAMARTLDAPPFRSPTQHEIQEELPKPSCGCQQAQYAVFVWVNPESLAAGWYLQMQTPVRPVPKAQYCPFCGDRLPALVRKNLPEGYPAECYYSSVAPQ